MNQVFSYWEQTSFLAGYDVVIVGSGIVGLSAAFHLKLIGPQLNICVLEAGFLPSGASTKNAGFACFGSISELIEDLETTSEDEILQLIEMKWKGLELLRKTLGDNSIDYQGLGGFEIFTKTENLTAKACIEKIGYVNKLISPIIGRPDIYAVANEKIADFAFKGVQTLIENRCEGQIDTGKMMKALIYKVQQLGVMIFNNCRLNTVKQTSPYLTLLTSQGNFSAKKVILANNAFITQLFPDLNILPGRGQVLLTEPIKNLKVTGAFHYDKGYYYFRNIDNRILLGGGRNINFKAEETLDLGITDSVQNALEKFLYELILPNQVPKIDQRWSGIMGFGKELQPIVKQIEPNIFCAVRCNGMGVAMGSLVGQQVANLVLASS